ncbi:hypothetical protein [Tatumella sp. UBA2305]|uniref:hypothetical protein n=1 Tax=Tatumella sp. UBA2305 TaxID=1947647 RepID=UPI0025D54457|nr:hypothetical protein [Tatumella sp. UBA2305]
MNEGRIIRNSREPLWDRRMAVHEAGHAIAAWLNGANDVEIVLADEFGVAKGANGNIAEGCRAACFHSVVHGQDEILIRLIILFAGVMAEHIYTGESADELLKKTGKGDYSDIREYLDKYRLSGATEDERIAMYGRAHTISLALIKRYWWEVIALAKMTEHSDYLSPASIRMLFCMFPSMSRGFNILKELEA